MWQFLCFTVLRSNDDCWHCSEIGDGAEREFKLDIRPLSLQVVFKLPLATIFLPACLPTIFPRFLSPSLLPFSSFLFISCVKYLHVFFFFSSWCYCLLVTSSGFHLLPPKSYQGTCLNWYCSRLSLREILLPAIQTMLFFTLLHLFGHWNYSIKCKKRVLQQNKNSLCT